MLTRVRIEVSDEASATAVQEALDKYEHVLQSAERIRYDDEAGTAEHARAAIMDWSEPLADEMGGRVFSHDFLGREVTDEVIEYDPSLPGYKGRRVVCFKRLDTRAADPCTCGPDEGCSDCPPKKFGRITPDKLRGEPSEPGNISGVTITKDAQRVFRP